jgi:hypothetical protein
LRLTDLIDYPAGKLRFHDREALCKAFGISSAAQIILTGVNVDQRYADLGRCPLATLASSGVPSKNRVRKVQGALTARFG